MKTSFRIAFCFVVILGASSWNLAQEKAVTEITVLVPERGQSETVVKINGKEVKGEGDTRIYKETLEKGKEYKFKVEALIEPNNYTKITRYKDITIKGGDKTKVDLTVKNPKTDKIVVRWVPTPDDIVDEMCKLAKVTKNDTVYDLGCGDAVMLIRPIQKFNAKKGVGIDIDPKILEKAKVNVKKAKLEDRIELRVGDILNVKDMADADVVLLYIGDDLGERLSPVLQKTCKKGARIVSHRFMLGDWTPSKSVTVKGADTYEYELHLWVVGEKKKAEKKLEAK